MLNGKRSGSNNLMNSLHHLTRTKMVWMDSPPDIWKTFGLSFSNDEFYLNSNISNCLDEIFQSNSGMKLNWDEPGYLDVVDEFLEPHQCYKTDQTYQNIENFSELEKLKDYLLL